MSVIKIDEVAATTDRNRISAAIPELQAARSALLRVMEEGENTKGETGKAIVEKANVLIHRINKLIQSLQETSEEIRLTIKLNQAVDAQMSSTIK